MSVQLLRVQRATCPKGQSAAGRWKWHLSILIALLLLGGLVYPVDMFLSQKIRQVAEYPGDLVRILELSELTAHGSGVLVILLMIWFLAPRLRIYLPRVATCAFSAGLVAAVLKMIFARFRPMYCPPQIQEVSLTWRGWFPASNEQLQYAAQHVFQSFPSAHTATSVGLAVALAWLLPRGKWMFVGFAILAGFQRIVFLAHWPSDVVAGAIVGLSFGVFFVLPPAPGNFLFDRLEQWLRKGRQLKTSRATAPEDDRSVDRQVA